jgi:membrane protease YdiL (CAAX protease family)
MDKFKILWNKLAKVDFSYWWFIFATAAAELIFTYINITIGVILYLLLFFSLLIGTSFQQNVSAYLNLALSQIPLMRITSVSIPLTGIPEIVRMTSVSVPLLLAGIFCAKASGLTSVEIRFGFRILRWQFLTTFLGLPLGFAGFFLIRPDRIVAAKRPEELIMWFLVFMLCTGFLEEFIFRGVLLGSALKLFGKQKAIFFASLLYAVLTISGQSLLNSAFAFFVSVLFCKLFIRQQSLLEISFAHGLMNCMIYIICPMIFNR